MNSQTVVLGASKPGNVVDELKAQIRRIQSSCRHKFRVVPGSFHFGKSKVEGVLLGSNSGSLIYMTVRCSDCSMEKRATAETTCPTCAGEMKKGEMHYREEYFPEGRHLYHGARLYHCEPCTITVAVDEWDQ